MVTSKRSPGIKDAQSPILRADVEPLLNKHGFKIEEDQRFGHMYTKPLEDGWNITAYCSNFDNFWDFSKEVDKDKYRTINLHLDKGGQNHIVKSADGLAKNLPKIIRALSKIAEDPRSITCPECGRRYMYVQKIKKGGQFMSCHGFNDKSHGGEPACKGSNHKMKTEFNYK